MSIIDQLNIIQAFSNGEEVEYSPIGCFPSCWKTLERYVIHNFNFQANQYRLARPSKPLVIEAWVNARGEFCAVPTGTQYGSYAHPPFTLKKFREIIE